MYQSRLGLRFYLLPSSPPTFPGVGPEPSPGPWKTKPKGHPAAFLPSCPSKYLTAFSKACVCVGGWGAVTIVRFVLVNEAGFVEVLINNFIKVLHLFWFVVLVLTAHVIKQPATG